MSKMRWLTLSILTIILTATLLLAACSSPSTTSPTTPVATSSKPATTQPTATAAPVKLYIGGTFALTGAYAQDAAGCLAGFQDYAKWVNENHILAPWYPDKKIPANITFEVLWADDELKPDKALTIYDEQKAKGLLVQRVSGSPQGLALIQKFVDDKVGATTMSAGPYVLVKNQTIFPNYSIYTDSLAAVADWFKAGWKDTSRKPRVAYLSASNAMGKQIDTPEMKAYLQNTGFEFVGSQFIDLVPTAPPTTALAWLKDNKVDLAIGVMVNPGSQATVKEAVRLGMGPTLDYKITFGFATPSHLQQFAPAMGQTGNGVVVGGGYAAYEDPSEGMKFAMGLMKKYHPDNTAPLYLGGVVEAMTQVEALRLAWNQVPVDKLKSADVLEKGFYQIKDLSSGGITSSPLTYSSSYSQGVNKVRIQQVQNGQVADLGSYPTHDLYTKQ